MTRSWLIAFFAAVLLGGCAALEQFPEVSDDYSTDLVVLDPSYDAALKAIGIAKADPKEQARIRNEEIDRRLAVIDANFRKFEMELARETVQIDFGVSLVAVGVGGAGALVSETASQILSAVSGGLAGAQAAYGKAALYDKALSALLQQMEAGRKTILVKIFEGRMHSIEEYPLSVAVHDLDAYFFAGSLPGAIIATSADAQVKSAQATIQLREITTASVTPEMFDKRKQLLSTIEGLDAAKSIALVTTIEGEFPGAKPFIDAQYPDNVRVSDRSGDKAKTLLKRLVVLTVRSSDDASKWQTAIDNL